MVKENNSKDKDVICAKCEEEIKEEDEEENGKSLIIEDLTFCEKCAKKIVNRCHTCREPIYEKELIYEITPNWSVENIFGLSHSEKVTQCDWCHRRGEKERKGKINGGNQRKGVLLIYSVLILFVFFLLLFPNLVENGKKINGRGYGILGFCFLSLFLSFIIILVLYGVILADFGDRHKSRKEEKIKERKLKEKRSKK